MSAARRIRRLRGQRSGLATYGHPALDRFYAEAPDCPGYGGGKWAVYSVGCCWWTSNPTRDGGRSQSGLPGCPTCGSVLMQAPLAEFMGAGVSKPDHYGPGGLAAFAAAHASPCHPTWDEYAVAP